MMSSGTRGTSSHAVFYAAASTQIPILQGGEDFSSGQGGDPDFWVLFLALVKGQADTQWIHIIYGTFSKTLIPSQTQKHVSKAGSCGRKDVLPLQFLEDLNVVIHFRNNGYRLQIYSLFVFLSHF